MSKEVKTIKNHILARLKYEQHEENMLIEILTDYPSLMEEVEKNIVESQETLKLTIAYEHRTSKPRIVKDGRYLCIVINN